LAVYSAFMFCAPFLTFAASSYTYLDRECAWGLPRMVSLPICSRDCPPWHLAQCKQGNAHAIEQCMPSLTHDLPIPCALAALYAVTIGIPSPDKRATVGGVLAVIVANIVSTATQASKGPRLHVGVINTSPSFLLANHVVRLGSVCITLFELNSARLRLHCALRLAMIT
jgi:hypothetical protein